jgi:hypothetical protein
LAKHDMAVFPGDRLCDWKEYWQGTMEFRDHRDLDHLREGLRKAGLQE